MKRREFLVGCSAALAIAGTGAGVASASAEAPLSRDVFLAAKNKRFRVYGPDSHFLDELRLVAVEDRVKAVPAGDVVQFDLVFEGAFDERLHEGAYLVQETESGRAHAMYLQPASETRGYRASFSLLA
jgi:Domain of unknown function (DUF6916)